MPENITLLFCLTFDLVGWLFIQLFHDAIYFADIVYHSVGCDWMMNWERCGR